MKSLVLCIAEFLVLLLLDVVGGVFYHPFHIETRLASTQQVARSFVWDGILMMIGAWLILIAYGAARKRVGTFGLQATVALSLAAAAGFLLKLGFITHNW